MTKRRRTQRGFTLAELMISLGLSSIVAAGVLMLTRAQLRAYDLNDSVVKAQQNARVGLEFIETQLRRACGGISSGQVAINIPGVTPVVKNCVQWYDSAVTSSGTFGTSGTTGADAIEIIYGYANSNGSFAATTTAMAIGTTTPTVSVSELTGFSVGDLVLVTDWKYGQLFKIATINGGSAPATGSGTLGFGTLTSASIKANANYTPAIGDGVIKANSIALYLVAGNATTPGQLYFDPDGMLSTNHSNAQPLIDGVSDFQLAFGIDCSASPPANGTANDGLITEAASKSLNNDEWIGNFAGETLPGTPWNTVAATAPILLQIRATLVVRTTNTYAEATNNVPASEDGAVITAAIASGRYPRYRTMRTIVAPRVWNLGE